MTTLTQYINRYAQSMHYVTITVLLVIAVVESLDHGFPLNLIVAVVTTSALEIGIKSVRLKRKPTMPLSAIITGLIIGLVVPFTASTLSVIIPSVLAILSKFFIRIKERHIFNPAVFGVLVTIALFSSIASHAPPGAASHGIDENVGGFAVSITLVPLLLFANYKARKLWTAIPYLISTAVLFHFTRLSTLNSLNTTDIIRFLEALPYFFASIIFSEPRTSPVVRNEQIVYGIGMAILAVGITLGFDSHIGALIAVLIGNLVYAVYRTLVVRKSKLLVVDEKS